MRDHEEQILSRLGSRFSLRFNPRARQIYSSPLGTGFDRPLRLEISVLSNGLRIGWPFSPGETFDFLRTRSTFTSFEFTCVSRVHGLELEARFTAPFYPRDEMISCAPFFYLDLACRDIQKEPGACTEMKVTLLGREGERVAREGANVLLQGDFQLARHGMPEELDEFSRRRIPGTIALIPLRGRMTLRETTFSLPCAAEEEATRASFILAAHCGAPVLDFGGTAHRLRYLQRFPSLGDVAAFAKVEEAGIRQKAHFFDDVIEASSLDRFEKDFIVEAFHSYLSRTWWTQDDGGSDWFGCWDEGFLHNAVDSEFEASLLELNLWPDLLRKRLAQRARMAQAKTSLLPDDADTGAAAASADPSNGSPLGAKTQGAPPAEYFFPSSFGRFLSLSPSASSGAGERERCRYLLMLFSYWRWWNDFSLIEENLSFIKGISSSLARSWQEGPKLFDEKTMASTPAMNLLCALHAAALMVEESGDENLALHLSRVAREIGRSLEAAPEILEGMDGLLHHIMCDNLPELNASALRKACFAQGGNPVCSHAAPSILRDITRAYFGHNLLQSQRYRSVELSLKNGGGSNSVPAASSNAAAFGLIQGLLGVKIDRVEQRVSLSPLCAPARLPLLPLADWEAQRAPWVEVWCEGSHMKTALLDGGFLEEKLDFGVDPHPKLILGNG
jgi:hypothetical protein